ncbi:MAG TPA: dioxygenase [Burkholderiaceae bacterium]|nr:dioxygenase [Burkholderiaceae bacterium]
MIIGHADDVTAAVLAEAARTTDARTREILSAGIRHLHAFVREARLSENEFRNLCIVIARVGQATNASHNEVMLAAGSLGVSSLVCLLNNDAGATGTTANLMGPFWRLGSPRTEHGGSIVRSPTPGDPVFVKAWVHDRGGRPVADAEVDVWHASPEGYYENQDPQQADMNLRGRFTTDADGHFAFRTVKPAGYPVPVDGPVGALLRAQGRHNMRPAHLHFLIHKPGYKTQFSQVYSADDPNLESDAQFGVTRALIAHYERHGAGGAPAGDVTGPWYSLERHFVIEPGDASLPAPPITGKATGPRPELTVLPRQP